MRIARLCAAAAAAVLVIGAQPLSALEAGARDKLPRAKAANRTKSVKRYRTGRRAAAGPAAGREADCTYFDNSKSDSDLDFRNPCDAEEFWRRQGNNLDSSD